MLEQLDDFLSKENKMCDHTWYLMDQLRVFDIAEMYKDVKKLLGLVILLTVKYHTLNK